MLYVVSFYERLLLVQISIAITFLKLSKGETLAPSTNKPTAQIARMCKKGPNNKNLRKNSLQKVLFRPTRASHECLTFNLCCISTVYSFTQGDGVKPSRYFHYYVRTSKIL